MLYALVDSPLQIPLHNIPLLRVYLLLYLPNTPNPLRIGLGILPRTPKINNHSIRILCDHNIIPHLVMPPEPPSAMLLLLLVVMIPLYPPLRHTVLRLLGSLLPLYVPGGVPSSPGRIVPIEYSPYPEYEVSHSLPSPPAQSPIVPNVIQTVHSIAENHQP